MSTTFLNWILLVCQEFANNFTSYLRHKYGAVACRKLSVAVCHEENRIWKEGRPFNKEEIPAEIRGKAIASPNAMLFSFRLPNGKTPTKHRRRLSWMEYVNEKAASKLAEVTDVVLLNTAFLRSLDRGDGILKDDPMYYLFLVVAHECVHFIERETNGRVMMPSWNPLERFENPFVEELFSEWTNTQNALDFYHKMEANMIPQAELVSPKVFNIE